MEQRLEMLKIMPPICSIDSIPSNVGQCLILSDFFPTQERFSSSSLRLTLSCVVAFPSATLIPFASRFKTDFLILLNREKTTGWDVLSRFFTLLSMTLESKSFKSDQHFSVRVYASQERTRCAGLCGWMDVTGYDCPAAFEDRRQ